MSSADWVASESLGSDMLLLVGQEQQQIKHYVDQVAAGVPVAA